MLANDQVADLSVVRSYTENIIEEVFQTEEPVLVEAPPSSGKTTAALQLAATSDTPVTYLCGRIDLYEEAQKKLEKNEHNVDFVEIPSPHRHCQSFQDNSPGDQEQLKKLYNKGYSGRKLHFLPKEDARTPCGEDCAYLQKLDKVENRIDEIDVLIGHHSHSHRDHYVKDRIVILDEYNADAFITSYPDPDSGIIDDPEQIVPAFLDSLANRDTTFPSKHIRDFTDLLVQRQNDTLVDVAVDWFTTHGASRSAASEMTFLSPSSFQHDCDHLLAPFLTLSLLCMERVGPEIEMAPHPESDIGSVWTDANLNPSTRVVRNRNTSKMTVLRPPDFSRAHQVVGLDGTPTVPLWNLLLPPESEFTVRRVLRRSEFTNFLESALNMSLIQIGDGMHHYASGRISAYDYDRFRSVKAIEGEEAPLISSKQALEKYKERDWLDGLVATIERDSGSQYDNLKDNEFKISNFASIKSSNTFEKDDLGMVFGTPYPGDDVIKQWAGLCGVGVEPDDDGENKTFVEASRSDLESTNGKEADITTKRDIEGTGDKIYEHYVHNQVVQAILRFGRDDSVIENGGATVYVSTYALPSWFDVSEELSVSASEKEVLIVDQLYEAFADNTDSTHSYQTAKSLKNRIEATKVVDSVSEKYVRNTLNSLVKNNIAECRQGYGSGGANQYKWNPNVRVESVHGASVVCGSDETYVLNRKLSDI